MPFRIKSHRSLDNGATTTTVVLAETDTQEEATSLTEIYEASFVVDDHNYIEVEEI